MSLISSIFGTDKDDEILESLYMIANVRIVLSVFNEGSLTETCFYLLAEHCRSGADSRESKYSQLHGLHKTLVRMGQLLLCRNAAGLG
jgi:hypothetical protein